MILSRSVETANELVKRFAYPQINLHGAPELWLPEERDFEIAHFNVRDFPEHSGLSPAARRLAALIEVADPEVTLAGFKSIAECLELGQLLREGTALLYGLQAAAIYWLRQDIAVALIASCTRLRCPFDFDCHLPYVAGRANTDQLLTIQLNGLPTANAQRIWELLDAHPLWSVELSLAVLEWLKTGPTTLRCFPWSYQGNAIVEHIHPTCVEAALQLFMVMPSQDTTVRRWTNALRERLR